MFQSIFDGIINSLPADPNGVIITSIVAIAIGVGALTTLLGALHSRPTISMIMFTFGTIMGYAVPAWMGWNVNRSFTIAIGGIIFGLLGYLLHRWCVAVCLGILVAAVATVILFDQTNIAPIPSPGQTVQTTATATLQQAAVTRWETASPSFRSLAPWVALTAFLASVVVAFALPKFGMAALYSLGGTVLTLFAIGLGHSSPKITWLDSLKSGPMTVAALGITMLLVGFLAQFGLVHRPAPKQPEDESTTQRRPEFG